MSNVSTIGIDLAKNVFQVAANDKQGNLIYNRRFKRAAFIRYLANLHSPCLIGLEACATAHYWGRLIRELGHEVKLLNPRAVKAYVHRNKNDARDAQAIAEAVLSKRLLPIEIKSVAQQDISFVQRARQMLIKQQTQLVNHIRSQLAEYGLVAAQGHRALEGLVGEVIAGEHGLDGVVCEVLMDLRKQWEGLKVRIVRHEKRLREMANASPKARRIMQLPGVAHLTAASIIAKVDDVNRFAKGSHFAAWLGLTPRVYASANKCVRGQISKQGDRHIRTYLIHGARSSLVAARAHPERDGAYYRWVREVGERMSFNRAIVAIANKHARMIWAMLRHERDFEANHAALWQ